MQTVVVALATLAGARGIEMYGWARQRVASRGLAQSTVEYALIGALIVVIASVAIGMLGTQVTTVFENMANALKGGK